MYNVFTVNLTGLQQKFYAHLYCSVVRIILRSKTSVYPNITVTHRTLLTIRNFHYPVVRLTYLHMVKFKVCSMKNWQIFNCLKSPWVKAILGVLDFSEFFFGALQLFVFNQKELDFSRVVRPSTTLYYAWLPDFFIHYLSFYEALTLGT